MFFPLFCFFLVSLIGFTGAIDSFGGSGSGYGAPSQSYGAPAPAASYGAPAPSYGAPSTSYNGAATGGTVTVTAIPVTNGGAKYAQIYSNLGALNTFEENYGNIDYTDNYNTGGNIGTVNGAYTTGVGMVYHNMSIIKFFGLNHY